MDSFAYLNDKPDISDVMSKKRLIWEWGGGGGDGTVWGYTEVLHGHYMISLICPAYLPSRPP